jgi:TonB family protein
MEKLAEFIKREYQNTETAKKEKIEGTVYVSFVIEADGSVSNAQVLRGIGGGLDEVAREAVMKMPGWKPGKKDGVAVPVRFNMPVKFKLDPAAPDKPIELPEKIVYQGREVYYKAEQMPEYTGGNEALLKYFRNYIPNLEFDSEHGKSTIYVSFIVEPDGSITPSGIAGSPEATVSDKFTEAIEKLKKWTPGKTRGAVVPVKLNYFFRINK